MSFHNLIEKPDYLRCIYRQAPQRNIIVDINKGFGNYLKGAKLNVIPSLEIKAINHS